jgi:carbohydrate kinase (thermoresistant glucokinase family)
MSAMRGAPPRPRIVVMGVSGCGKSTVGCLLAQALGVAYIEGDSLHPAQNVARMAAGIALTDTDRQGWLQAVARRLGDAPSGVVASCSALKRSYRDLLRDAAPDARFVHLHGEPALLAARMQSRPGHYMPASLLHSQLDTLEPPGADEAPITIDIARPVAAIVAEICRQLHGPPRQIA